MANKEYRLNPQTLTYEVITAPLRLRFYRLLRKLLIGFILASLVNLAISYFFYTPKMYRLNESNKEMMLKYNLLHDRIGASMNKLTEVKHRDNNVYRAIFSADTLSLPGVYLPYPESKYADMHNDRYSSMIIDVWKGLDAMTRLLYLESLSLDELESLTKDKGKMSLSIPAISPVNKKQIKSLSSHFGWRLDPFTLRHARHSGIDFSANIGTPVYATGDGKIIRDNGTGTGYGKQILIDHGYGYVTRYAHLHRAEVVMGQKIRRGQKIGEVGNTGRSSGPHLHYEVIYRGIAVNPVNYFRDDLSDQAFQKIIENAEQ